MTLLFAPASGAPPPRRWRQARGWILALLLAGGAILFVQLVLLRPVPLPVRTVRAERGLVEETVSSTKAGALRSRLASAVSVDVAGTIVTLHARQGAQVRQGDLLVSIDRRDADAALAATRRELSVLDSLLGEARTKQADAARERERFRELRKTESASQSQFDQAETLADMAAASAQAAAARVESQKAAVTRAEIAVEKCDLHAPFKAVVADLYVELGEWAVPGKVAMKLIDPDHLYVRAELDEVDLAGVRVGLPARVTLDPYKNRKLAAKVTRVAPYVSELQEQNRTVEIELEFTGGTEGLDLKHGTSADVEVILREEPGVLRIPAQALLEGNRVLIAAADGRARARTLKIGVRNWEFAHVLEGLAEGERVIVSLESEKLKDGVRIQEAAEPPR